MLKRLRERLAGDAGDEERLRARMSDLGLTPIAEVATRTPVTIGGEVQASQVVPRAGSPSLEITVEDGSGRAVAVFTGRKRLSGVVCGRRMLLEGVGRQEHGRLVIVNPAYTLLDQ